MLAQLCSGQIDCDIVCLDLTSSRLHQILRKANLNLPRERGIVFELKLYDLLSSQSSRINAISNGRLLVDKCKAKNLIFSSAARHYLDLRSPADTVNLCALYAIPSHLRKATVYQTAERALKHSQIRKMPVKNAIEILDNADQWIQNALSD